MRKRGNKALCARNATRGRGTKEEKFELWQSINYAGNVRLSRLVCSALTRKRVPLYPRGRVHPYLSVIFYFLIISFLVYVHTPRLTTKMTIIYTCLVVEWLEIFGYNEVWAKISTVILFRRRMI